MPKETCGRAGEEGMYETQKSCHLALLLYNSIILELFLCNRCQDGMGSRSSSQLQVEWSTVAYLSVSITCIV